MSRRNKIVTAAAAFIIAVVLILFENGFFVGLYQRSLYDKLDEYYSYTTSDGSYTVSVRDVSEAGLSGSARLNVYLVDNSDGGVRYIGCGRLDYYEDFTPYIDCEENGGKATVYFHNKNSTDEFEIDTLGA